MVPAANRPIDKGHEFIFLPRVDEIYNLDTLQSLMGVKVHFSITRDHSSGG